MEAVKILGIDILRDQPFRDYQLLEIQQAKARPAGSASANGSRDFNTQQFLQILTSAQTVVITEKLATRRNYPLGSTMRLMIGDRVLPFVVRGVLKNEGPARVLDGNFIMMDIAAAQLAFDRLGRVDRIDVLLPEGADVHRDLEAIAKRLPAGAVGAAAVAAQPAGRDDAGGVSHQPDRAVVDRADRRAVPGLQHGHDLGGGTARRRSARCARSG